MEAEEPDATNSQGTEEAMGRGSPCFRQLSGEVAGMFNFSLAVLLLCLFVYSSMEIRR